MSAAARVESPSVFSPAGVEAAVLGEVGWVLVVGATLIFVAVMALLAWALRSDGARRPAATAWWVVGGGIVLPLVVLSALVVYGTARTAGLERGLARPGLVIAVTGRLWWWEVRYQEAGDREVVSANELRVPVGRSVQIALRSDNVLHSFWVPALGGKMDLVPGRVNHLVVTADRAGVYRGQCAEYCGEQHAKMALHVVALPADEFDRWLDAEAQPAPGAGVGALAAGRGAFVAQGCSMCHTVRGVAEAGTAGPDLTHVANRVALGAGALGNDGPPAIREWIAGVQRIKPGAQMPSYAGLDAATLDALAAFLGHRR